LGFGPVAVGNDSGIDVAFLADPNQLADIIQKQKRLAGCKTDSSNIAAGHFMDNVFGPVKVHSFGCRRCIRSHTMAAPSIALG